MIHPEAKQICAHSMQSRGLMCHRSPDPCCTPLRYPRRRCAYTVFGQMPVARETCKAVNISPPIFWSRWVDSWLQAYFFALATYYSLVVQQFPEKGCRLQAKNQKAAVYCFLCCYNATAFFAKCACNLQPTKEKPLYFKGLTGCKQNEVLLATCNRQPTAEYTP